MAGENQKIINVIRQAVDQGTSQGANMTLTSGYIDTASGYTATAYLRGEDFIGDVNIPAGMHLAAGDYVSVGQVGSTAWIDRVLPTSSYAQMEFDVNTGKVYAGTGAAEPSEVMTIGSAGLSADPSYTFGTEASPFNIFYAKKVNSGSNHLYLSANTGSQVWIGASEDPDYIRLGHSTNGATEVLPGTDGDIAIGSSSWKYQHMLAKFLYAEGDGAEGYVHLRRDNGGSAASTWQTQGIIAGAAWDGDSFHTVGNIRFLTEDSVADGAVNGRISFWTAGDDGVVTQRCFLTKDGHLYPVLGETYNIGWQNGGGWNNIVVKTILPSVTGTPATGTTIGSSTSVWPTIHVQTWSSDSTLNFYPSNVQEAAMSSTAFYPTTDAGLDIGLDTQRFASAYVDDLDVTNDIEAGGTITATGIITGGNSSPYTYTYLSTGSSTWTKPSNLHHIIVECQGAGGGGGGTGATGSSEGASAAGGGGGGYARAIYAAGDLPASCSVSVGSGGSAGTSGGGTGGTGGDTTFSGTGITTLTGEGGGGGTGDAGGSGFIVKAGGAAGDGTGPTGVVQARGGPGNTGHRASTTDIASATGLAVGMGGYAHMGGGGRPNESGGAYNGQLYGGGGAGSWAHHNDSAAAGGAGAQGTCIVTEYYFA